MKRIFMLLVAFATLLPTASAATSKYYSDISSDHKYAESISVITEMGIVSGYPDGTYRPDKTLNRAELLRIVDEAFLDLEDETDFPEDCFRDVPNGAWFSDYVCLAKALGHVEGYQDGTFRPARAVSLMEALTIILETKSLEEYEEFKEEIDPDSPWYSAILQTAILGDLILKEFPDLHENINRGQMAEILLRVQYFEENEDKLEEFDPLQRKRFTPKSIFLDVPFTAQAPTGQWVPPYDEACEEAALLMVHHYINGTALNANSEILALTQWVQDNDYIIDVDTQEMSEIALNYYGHRSKIYHDEDVTVENIKRLVASGYPVILPVAGRHIGNVDYPQPGPPYHVVVVVGYNADKFFAHDPGISSGYRYGFDQETLVNGVHDWVGSKSTILEGPKAMLVLEK